jgi:hypothetical protein
MPAPMQASRLRSQDLPTNVNTYQWGQVYLKPRTIKRQQELWAKPHPRHASSSVFNTPNGIRRPRWQTCSKSLT